ncbi:MAG: glycosyltransferase family 1 protein [Pseudomonadota bacterium]
MTQSPVYPLAFNGRFLSAKLSGVHRVALELVRAFDALVAETPRLAMRFPGRVIRPPGSRDDLELRHFEVVEAGRLTGQAWEQFELNKLAGDAMLLNFGNLSPVFRSRSVTMIHDAQVFSSPQSYSLAFRSWYKFAHMIIGRRAARLLTVSEFSKEQLSRFGIGAADDIGVVYNGVDHVFKEVRDNSIVRELDLRHGEYVLALSNTQAHKNISVLFEAMRSPRAPSWKLVLFGSATAEDFLALGAPPPSNTVFAGHVTDPQLRGLMEHAGCLAFPSRTEGFGLPPLEAMALGCPVIASPFGALPEVCGNDALYADATDASAWAEAIASIAAMTDEERALKCDAARSHVRQYTWRTSAKRLLEEIESLAGQNAQCEAVEGQTTHGSHCSVLGATSVNENKLWDLSEVSRLSRSV